MAIRLGDTTLDPVSFLARKKEFPRGFVAKKPFLRVTPQPNKS